MQTGELESEETADDAFMDAIKDVSTDSDVWDDDGNIET